MAGARRMQHRPVALQAPRSAWPVTHSEMPPIGEPKPLSLKIDLL